MNVLGQFLDQREDHSRDRSDADLRWLKERAGIDPAERLQRWDAWLQTTLSKTLVFPAGAGGTRLLTQCAAEITRMVRQLRGRGWLLEGDALAQHVRACLAPIGQAQRAGKVADFWPYFRASVGRYVGQHAEEIQAHALRSGADEGAQAIGAVLSSLSALRPPSLTELLAERDAEVRQAKSLRAAQADRRRADKQAAENTTPSLF